MKEVHYEFSSTLKQRRRELFLSTYNINTTDRHWSHYVNRRADYRSRVRPLMQFHKYRDEAQRNADDDDAHFFSGDENHPDMDWDMQRREGWKKHQGARWTPYEKDTPELKETRRQLLFGRNPMNPLIKLEDCPWVIAEENVKKRREKEHRDGMSKRVRTIVKLKQQKKQKRGAFKRRRRAGQ